MFEFMLALRILEVAAGVIMAFSLLAIAVHEISIKPRRVKKRKRAA